MTDVIHRHIPPRLNDLIEIDYNSEIKSASFLDPAFIEYVSGFFSDNKVPKSEKMIYKHIFSRNYQADISLIPEPCIILSKTFTRKIHTVRRIHGNAFSDIGRIHLFTKNPCYINGKFRPKIAIVAHTNSNMGIFSITLNLFDQKAMKFIRSVRNNGIIFARQKQSFDLVELVRGEDFGQVEPFFDVIDWIIDFIDDVKHEKELNNKSKTLNNIKDKKKSRKRRTSMRCSVYGCNYLIGSCPLHV